MRRFLTRLVLALLGITVLGLLAYKLAAVGTNTLGSNPRWKSTKPELRRGVIGAHAFVHGKQALAGDRLNVTEWLGHQEVLTSQADLSPDVIEYDFNIDWMGYVDLIVGYGPDGYRGVRLAALYDRQEFITSFGYRANFDGVFIEKRPLTERGWQADGTTHRVRIEFPDGDGAAIVKVNGVTVGEIPPGPTTGRVGFRGAGVGRAWIDNLSVEANRGGFKEDFSGRPNPWPILVQVAGLVLLAMLLIKARVRDFKTQSFAFVVFTFLGSAVLVTAWIGVGLRTKFYPADTATRRAQENAAMAESADYYIEDARKNFADLPASGEYRVLLMGSSQTFGAGARNFEETVFGNLQKILDEKAPVGKTYRLLNGAVSGSYAKFQRERLQTWLEFKPAVVVINLCLNDSKSSLGKMYPDPEVLSDYRADIEGMIDLAEAAGAAVILVGEPGDPEFNYEADGEFGNSSTATRAIIKELATERNLPYVEAQDHFLEQVNNGHFWWDQAHLSSHGQAMLSDLIAPAILRVLAERP